MFRTRDLGRRNSPFFKRGADDSDDFWSNLDERNAQHRQHVKLLVIASAVFAVPGIFVHTGFFVFSIAVLIPVPLELFMIRRTRSRVKIPDYRPPERVEIELDGDG